MYELKIVCKIDQEGYKNTKTIDLLMIIFYSASLQYQSIFQKISVLLYHFITSQFSFYQFINTYLMGANIQPLNLLRFQHPLYIKTNEIVTHSISVNGYDLYYQPYTEDSVKILINQYSKFTNQKMKLELGDFILPSETPLKHFALTEGGEKMLEEFLNISQKPDHLSVEWLSGQNLYNLQRVFSCFNSTTNGEILQQMTPINKGQNNIETPKEQNQVNFDTPEGQPLKKSVKFENQPIKIAQYKPTTVPIKILNAPKGQIKLEYKIDKDTTISDVIKQGCRVASYDFQDMVQCCDENKQIINTSDYKTKISLWKIMPKEIILTIINNNCYYHHTSALLIQDIDKSMNIHLNDFHVEKSKIKEISALTYNMGLGQLQKSSIQSILQQKQVNYYYQIHASGINLETDLKCSPHSMFLTDNHQWIQARNLTVNDKIMGIEKDNKISVFIITKIKSSKQEISQKYYCITSPKNSNIILNNLIVHNRNTIDLEVHYINQHVNSVENMSVYRSIKIQHIFGQNRCQIAGTLLDNSLTFGDYFISDRMIIQVYQKSLSSLKYVNQILFFQKEEITYNLAGLDEELIKQLKLKWSQDYLGISQKQIFPLQNKLYDSLSKTKLKHLLLCIKNSLQPLNYIHNVRQKYKPQQQNQYLHYKQYISTPLFLQKSKRKYATAVKLYTSNEIYGDLNKFLYKQYGKLGWEKNNQKMIGIVGWFYQEFASEENYQDNGKFSAITYRGIKNISLKEYFGLNDVKKNETVVLSNFTSTSKNITRATSFSNSAGAILTFHCKTGKNISKYSVYSNEEEIVLLPWSHFIIKQYNLQSRPQTATLEQIPLPQFNTDKIIFWVDDNPIQNRSITSNHFLKKGIQVVQILTTRMMQLIIKKYFWLYRLLGKKIIIISDMARIQDGKMNENAGAELAEFVLKQYGISYPFLLYVLRKISAMQKLRKNGVFLLDQHIVTNQNQLVELVINQFDQ